MRTIDIRIAVQHVNEIGGNATWKEALGLANAKAITENGRLVSQDYHDASVNFDKDTDEYVITFKLRE